MNRRPHPSLRKLERLIGRWKVSGDAHGNVTFNWMEGGFFVVQDIDLDDVKGIEFIGYDNQTGDLRSHYFDDRGNAREYVYKTTGADHIITIDMPGIKGEFNGKFSDDGKSISGRWNWEKGGNLTGDKARLTKLK